MGVTNSVKGLFRSVSALPPTSSRIGFAANIAGKVGELYQGSLNGKGVQTAKSVTAELAVNGLADGASTMVGRVTTEATRKLLEENKGFMTRVAMTALAESLRALGSPLSAEFVAMAGTWMLGSLLGPSVTSAVSNMAGNAARVSTYSFLNTAGTSRVRNYFGVDGDDALAEKAAEIEPELEPVSAPVMAAMT